MTTNQELYKTANSRREAFIKFCRAHECAKCPALMKGYNECRFKWLELPADVQLKPCPFCGGEAVLDVYKGTGLVSCKSCTLVTQTGDDVLSAVEAWNRRSPIRPTADNADDDWDDCLL